MKITVIGPAYPAPGGIAKHTTEIYRHLAQQALVQCVSFTRLFPRLLHPGRAAADGPREKGVEYILDTLNPWTWRTAVRRVQEFNPEIVIMPWWTTILSPLYLYLLRSLAQPVERKIVLICHSVGDKENTPLSRRLTGAVLNRAHCLVTECADAADAARRIGGAHGMMVSLPHPVARSGAPAKLTRQEARQTLGLEANRPLLLFYGYARKYKGLECLIEAMPLVARAKGALLVVAGEFWSGKNSALAQIARHKLESHVHLWDRYVTAAETELLFTACDCVVMPYLKSSGSGVFSLAAQYECPVVTSSVGAFRELVKDRVTGRLVPPQEPGLLAEAIIETLDPDVLARYRLALRNEEQGISWSEYAGRILAAVGCHPTPPFPASEERLAPDGP